jgi:hypothetical protein
MQTDSSNGRARVPTTEEIKLQTTNICRLGNLTPAQARLLWHLVEETLADRKPSEKSLAASFFKKQSFDPAADASVRGEVHKIRTRLEEFYKTERGDAQPIRLTINKYLVESWYPEYGQETQVAPDALRKRPDGVFKVYLDEFGDVRLPRRQTLGFGWKGEKFFVAVPTSLERELLATGRQNTKLGRLPNLRFIKLVYYSFGKGDTDLDIRTGRPIPGSAEPIEGWISISKENQEWAAMVPDSLVYLWSCAEIDGTNVDFFLATPDCWEEYQIFMEEFAH